MMAAHFLREERDDVHELCNCAEYHYKRQSETGCSERMKFVFVVGVSLIIRTLFCVLWCTALGVREASASPSSSDMQSRCSKSV